MSAAPEPARGRRARNVELALSLYASMVFVALWLYVAAAIFSDGQLLSETWTWLAGLPFVAAVVAWVLVLPVAVFAWAWQADLDSLWMAIVMAGLLIWTGVAWGGLVRTLARRSRSGA